MKKIPFDAILDPYNFTGASCAMAFLAEDQYDIIRFSAFV